MLKPQRGHTTAFLPLSMTSSFPHCSQERMPAPAADMRFGLFLLFFSRQRSGSAYVLLADFDKSRLIKEAIMQDAMKMQ
jgi:hypothetical protein